MSDSNENKNLPSVPFSAEHYRREYQTLKSLMPNEAKKVREAVKDEFRAAYDENKLPASGTKAFWIGGSGLLSIVAAAGLGAASVLAAAVAVPLGMAGVVAVCAANDRKRFVSTDIDSRIDHDLAHGDLLKKYIDGMKRYKKPLPGCFDVFSDKAMLTHYLPPPESQPLRMPPMVLLTGAFSGETAEKETKPAALPPPAPKKDPKP